LGKVYRVNRGPFTPCPAFARSALDILPGRGHHQSMKLQAAPGGTTQDIFNELVTPAIDLLKEGIQVEGSEYWGRVVSQREPVVVEAVRELSAEEVAVLPSDKFAGAPLNTGVQKLKIRHHEIARLMAAGLSDKDIMENLGGSRANLHLLRRNPAFQNLLLAFMAERDAQAMDLAGQIRQTAALAVDQIQQRLEDPEMAAAMPLKALTEISVAMLDRAGFNPTTKIASVSVGVTAKTLEELRNAAPATVYDAANPQAGRNGGGGDGSAVVDITPGLGKDQPEQGGEGQRESVRKAPRQGAEEATEVQLELL
jgi:hypothetical protein